MDITNKPPVILSLCTGMRGLERGLERAIGHLAIAAYVEIEAFIIYNLVAQMEQGVVDAAPVWSDLKTFPASAFHGKVHGVIGGYPCQPFSVAGELKGADDPRHLWPYIKDHIRQIRPLWCFFENVANHLNLGYREVRTSLEEMGYTVKEGIFSAEEVGAPHQRKRLFILAVDNSVRQQDEWYNACGFHRLFSGAGEELGDSEEQREREPSDEALSFPVSREARSEFSQSGYEVMANNNNTGCGESGRSCSIQPELLPAECGSGDKWPAGQGSYQYPWEEPRTVEPGVGCTVNGYNFRNDLLRMYGNGVVEQTAELAFITLIQKHLSDEKSTHNNPSVPGNGYQ